MKKFLLASFIFLLMLTPARSQSIYLWFTDDGYITGEGLSEMNRIGENSAPTAFPYALFEDNIDSYLSFKEHFPLGFPPDYSQEWIERAYLVIYQQYFFTAQMRFESYVRSSILSINPNTIFPDNVNMIGLHQDFTTMTRAAWLQCAGDLTCYDQKLFSIWNALSVKYGLSGGGPIASGDTHQYYDTMPKLVFMDNNLMFFMWLCLNE